MSGGVIQGSFLGGRPKLATLAPAPVAQPRMAQAPGAPMPAAQASAMPRQPGPPAPAYVAQPRMAQAAGGAVPRQPGPPAPAHVAQPRTPQAQPRSAQPQAAGGAIAVDPALLRAAGRPGQPLPDAVQRKMEQAFSTDFSSVRVHEGPQAESIGAIAFTVGSDIYFAPGRFQPHTAAGQQLLGHELAHVLQQRAGRVRNPLGSGLAVVQDHALEAEADRMGHRAAAQMMAVAPKSVHPRAPEAGRFAANRMASSIQLAGHQENFYRIGGSSKILKTTNSAEKEMYELIGGSSELLKTTNPAEKKTYERCEFLLDVIPLAELSPQEQDGAQEWIQGHPTFIVMQDMFSGISPENLIKLDIKIGHSTASKQQLFDSEEKSKNGAFLKKLKMAIGDKFTQSSTRGWRYIPDHGSRAWQGRYSEENIDAIIHSVGSENFKATLSEIILGITKIRYRVWLCDYTFVAASILIVVDKTNYSKTRVVLIDLAHPIHKRNNQFGKYNRRFLGGITDLLSYFTYLRRGSSFW